MDTGWLLLLCTLYQKPGEFGCKYTGRAEIVRAPMNWMKWPNNVEHWQHHHDEQEWQYHDLNGNEVVGIWWAKWFPDLPRAQGFYEGYEQAHQEVYQPFIDARVQQHQ